MSNLIAQRTITREHLATVAANPEAPLVGQAAAAELLARRLGRTHLEDFTVYTMPEYEVNWHHRITCERIDALVRGDIKRLMVFEPPRHGKSELTSRRLPAFALGNNPDARIIATSYSADLAISMSRSVQSIMDSKPYRALFPGVQIPPKGIGGRWAGGFGVMGHKGFYRSAGVGGAITGFGFDIGIIDDPVKNRQEADSAVSRAALEEWYTSTFYTRQERDAAILITLTRWNEADLAGWLLDLMKRDKNADRWEVISLPAIAEAPLDPLDIRAIGEPLWASKYPLQQLQVMRATMGERDWSALMQQRPSPKSGSTFNRAWFDGQNRFDYTDSVSYNQVVARWLSFDTAMKTGPNNDYTAYTVAELLSDHRLQVREVARERVEFPALVDLVTRVALQWNYDGKLQGVIIEDKGSGTSATQTLLQSAAPWLRATLKSFMPIGSKVFRAEKAAVWMRNGSVLLPDAAPWLDSFEGELFGFPAVAHDDRVDSLVQLVLFLENVVSGGFYTRMGWTKSVNPHEGPRSARELILEAANRNIPASRGRW